MAETFDLGDKRVRVPDDLPQYRVNMLSAQGVDDMVHVMWLTKLAESDDYEAVVKFVMTPQDFVTFGDHWKRMIQAITGPQEVPVIEGPIGPVVMANVDVYPVDNIIVSRGEAEFGDQVRLAFTRHPDPDSTTQVASVAVSMSPRDFANAVKALGNVLEHVTSPEERE